WRSTARGVRRGRSGFSTPSNGTTSGFAPVSSLTLRKTGILPNVAREFAQNRPRRPKIGIAETKRSAEKTHVCAIFHAFSDVMREHRKAGWGAWIRTREWRNQNPLPYHLATPQCRHAATRAGSRAAGGP